VAEHVCRVPLTSRQAREHHISPHFGQRGKSLPCFLHVEHWTSCVQKRDFCSNLARMGCSSSVGEAGGDVEGEEEVEVEVEAGEEGENDDEWWVVRVIYGIAEDVEEEDESSSSRPVGE
jgi:hypothetical protein